MSYDYAMKYYGIDKPDVRFDMKFVELTDLAKGKVHSFTPPLPFTLLLTLALGFQGL